MTVRSHSAFTRPEESWAIGSAVVQEALKFMDHDEAPMRAYAIDTLRKAVLDGEWLRVAAGMTGCGCRASSSH